ncbi:Uncharacterised protein [uncultured archaeon]|nr:Uncharacterised protein [uncultured archaeon]
MGIYYPLGHVLRINSLDLARQGKLCVHLLYHRPKRLIRAVLWPGCDICGIVGEAESLVLRRSAKPSAYGVHELHDVLRVLVLGCCLVKFKRIPEKHIHIMRLLIDLVGIDARGQHKRCIHLATALVREVRAREIEEAIHQEHYAVLVAVALEGSNSRANEAVMGVHCQVIHIFIMGAYLFFFYDFINEHIFIKTGSCPAFFCHPLFK